MENSIFQYTSAHKYLRDAWREKQKKNPQFSIRSWAKKIGLKSNAPLSLMLGGKRAIPRKYVPKLSQTLGLSSKESNYLEILLAYEHAKSIEEKEYYEKRLRDVSPASRVNMTEVDVYKYLQNPMHFVLLEMSELPDFKLNLAWLQARLRSKHTQQELKEVIERLLHLGLFEKTSNTSIKKKNVHITNKNEVYDAGVQEFHKNIGRVAGDLISNVDIKEREYNSYAFNINKSALPQAKERIKNFVGAFIKEFEALPGEGEETYQYSTQFFPQTKMNKEKAK